MSRQLDGNVNMSTPWFRAQVACRAVVEECYMRADVLEAEARAFRMRALQVRAHFRSGQFDALECIVGKEDAQALKEEQSESDRDRRVHDLW